jgi:hypothetical protein
MKSDSEMFETVRRVLALKRYEQPPPGYFESFSLEVMTRIEDSQVTSNRGRSEETWLQRLWGALEATVAPAAFGAAVCGLVVLGVARSEDSSSRPFSFGDTTANPVYSQPVGSTESPSFGHDVLLSDPRAVMKEASGGKLLPGLFQPEYGERMYPLPTFQTPPKKDARFRL